MSEPAITENNQRLKNLANMAKNGIGNEKDNAERLLKQLCTQHGLDYDSVMRDLLIEEFSYKFDSKKISSELVVHILAKYAMLEGNTEYWYGLNRGNTFKAITIKTTHEKWGHFMAVITVILRKFAEERKAILKRHRQEKKLLLSAFIHKHNIYYPYSFTSKAKPGKKLTDEDLAAIVRMSGGMDDDLKLYRQIERK